MFAGYSCNYVSGQGTRLGRGAEAKTLMWLLIVDDEAPLVHLLGQYLQRTGYQVDSCEDAARALELVKANPGRYSVVVTDLALPGMSGDELIAQARTVAPELKGVITSGYAYTPRYSDIVFLQKPFSPKALVDVLALLAGPGR